MLTSTTPYHAKNSTQSHGATPSVSSSEQVILGHLQMPVTTATDSSVPTRLPGMNTVAPRVPPTGSHATRPPRLHVESAHMPSPMRDTAATPHARRSPQFLDHGVHEFSVGPCLHEHGTSHISPQLDNSNKSTTHASGIVDQYPCGSEAPRSDSSLPIDILITPHSPRSPIEYGHQMSPCSTINSSPISI